MLPSGADIKIGAYEFVLDRQDPDPYNHFYESLYNDNQEIEGAPGKRTANPNYLFWRFDDWADGEGVKYFDTLDPNTYWYGTTNPRKPGSLTAPPDVTATTGLTATTATPVKLILLSAAGTLWFLANRQLFYSTNGTSWTAHASNPVGVASDQITAACTTGDEIWYGTDNGTTREVWKATTSTVTQSVSDVIGPEFVGMAELEGFIYGFTGKNLLRYNSKATLPITQSDKHKVFKPHTDAPAGTYYGGMVSVQNGIAFFISYTGDTTVYLWKSGRAFPLWYLPGITGRAITYHMGMIMLLGEQANKCLLYGLNLRSRQEFLLAEIGSELSNSAARAIAPTFGSNVMIAVNNGSNNYFYNYDLARDALSTLDEQAVGTKGTASAVVAFGSKRLAAYNDTTTVKADSWNLDDQTPSRSWQWFSSAYDMKFPQDQKVLLGFHVTQDPQIAAGTLQVYYQLDEDGTWTSAGSTVAGDKHRFLDLTGTTKKFRTLRVRVDGAAGCRMLSLTAKAYMNSYQQGWRLVLKLKDEKGSDAESRPSSRTKPAHILRTYLHTLVSDQNIVTFLDGARIPKKGGSGDGYTSHTVVVEFPEDHIKANAEGQAIVVLRDVTTS